MALVWFYGQKKQQILPKPKAGFNLLKIVFSGVGSLLFLAIIFGLAFLEEGLWDAWVWKEHAEVFSVFRLLPNLSDEVLLRFLIPFLALPQLTHYILDGFIWKVSRDNNLK